MTISFPTHLSLPEHWEHAGANWRLCGGRTATLRTTLSDSAFLLLATRRHSEKHKTEASAKPLPMHPALKLALLEWRARSHRTQPTDFVFPSRLYGGRKALGLAAVLKRKIRPAFERVGITGVGLAHVPPHGGNGAGRTGRASVDDPRLLASLQSQRDQQVLASGIEDEAERSGKTGRGDSAGAFAARENCRNGCTRIAPRFQKCHSVTA